MNIKDEVEIEYKIKCPLCGNLKSYKKKNNFNRCKHKPCKSCSNSLKMGGNGSVKPMGGLKKCSKCKELKSLDSFYFYEKKERYHSLCSDCKKTTFKTYQKDIGRFARYGITKNRYDEMFEEQSGKCYTCEQEFPVLYIDHNHNTGNVRKLLCRDCNAALGLLKENKQTIKNLIKYVENYGTI